MVRLKEMKGSGGSDELRQELAQAERDRDNALQEVADLKKLLAEQNRQLAAAAKTRFATHGRACCFGADFFQGPKRSRTLRR